MARFNAWDGSGWLDLVVTKNGFKWGDRSVWVRFYWVTHNLSNLTLIGDASFLCVRMGAIDSLIGDQYARLVK